MTTDAGTGGGGGLFTGGGGATGGGATGGGATGGGGGGGGGSTGGGATGGGATGGGATGGGATGGGATGGGATGGGTTGGGATGGGTTGGGGPTGGGGVMSVCGDGALAATEQCDDANTMNNDGCSSTCTQEPGFSCTGMPSTCRATCGDGVVVGSETCDDMNISPGDGCGASCATETGFNCTGSPSTCVTTCGDGLRAGTEVCDDQNTASGDGCSATCQREMGFMCDMASPTVCVTSCGDGQIAGAEQCDDANMMSGDGCNNMCATELGFSCNGMPSMCVTACGDGVRAGAELCDDNNLSSGDGCSATCTIESGYQCPGMPLSTCSPICGDGTLVAMEQCDDGNMVGTDGCSAMCTTETGFGCTGMPSTCASVCGDGVKASNEGCDDGNLAATDGCSATCTQELGFNCTGTMPSVCATTCGDGVVAGAETCDDANTSAGDGCSVSCAVEAGFSCTGAPSSCSTTCGDGVAAGTEQCDDGNVLLYDGCSATCTNEPRELEPNDDGMVGTGGTGILGNDFDAVTDGGVPVAVTNALAQGVILRSVGDTFRAATITPIGDEDVFAIRNDGADAVIVRVDTWNPAAGFGLGVACAASIDTGLQLRDQFGTSLASNDDHNGAADRCSGASLVLAPGATLYAHVMEFGDNIAIANYIFQVRFVPIVCGDGTVVALAEECDDGNTSDSDGCSAVCSLEASTEAEPNEDGTPSTGGTGIVGNDFDVGGSVATTNALIQGLSNAATTNRNWRAALTPAGDEDVFAFANPSGVQIEVQFDTYDLSVGVGRPCTFIDTGINVRNAAGAVLFSNDNRVTGDSCSRVFVTIPAGQTMYVHVTEQGDNGTVGRYALTSRRVVCGDGTAAGNEECDDANTLSGDGCSSLCQLESFVTEVEPNDTTPQADTSPIQLTGTGPGVRGSISATTDVDVYRLTLATAATIRMETFTVRPNFCDTTTTTTLRILNSAGTEITNDAAPTANGSGIAACAAMVIPLAAGTYYVRVEETGVNAVISKYFLEVVSTSSVGTETEPNETAAASNGNLTLVSEQFCSGDHSVNTDSDVYSITVPPGRGVRAEIVEGDRVVETCESNGVDSRLTLLNSNGTSVLVDDDDDGRGFCSLIDGTGNTPRDGAAFNGTALPQQWFLQVRASSFSQTGVAGQFVYKLNVIVR